MLTWDTSASLFSYLNVLIDEPPKWLNNPITDDRVSSKLEPWWKISDFDDSVGDIKLIWEQSRMNWVLALNLTLVTYAWASILGLVCECWSCVTNHKETN